MTERARVTVAQDPAPPGLEIWDDAWNLWGWEADPSFVIITDDVDRAGAALRVAVPRLHATTFAGTEISDSTDIDGTEESETPHSMWGPEPHEKGWFVWGDTQTNLSVKMRDHMVQVLVEELERAGVNARIEPQ